LFTPAVSFLLRAREYYGKKIQISGWNRGFDVLRGATGFNAIEPGGNGL
jgi:hypothetical protein